MLKINELQELIDNITNKIQNEIITANRCGYLEDVLKKYGMYEEEYFPCEKRLAKVLVIGQSSIAKDDLVKVIKKYKFDDSRFEFILDYDEAQNFNMEHLRYNNKYSDVFVGPMPHKTTGMGDCSSIIAKIESNPSEFPKLGKMMNGNELKITKQSFEHVLLESQFYELFTN